MSQKHNGQGEAHELKVLVVDDEREICFLLSTMLERTGARCRSAYSLSDGQEALNTAEYDVVFLDINLPDGLGYNLIPVIRSGHPQTRIIAISAVDQERARAHERGADTFVSKPFDRNTIFSTLQRLGVSK